MNKEDIILEFMKDENYTPMKAKEMAILLGVPKKENDEFRQTLRNLEENYKIVKNKKNRYRLIGENYVEGIYRKNQNRKSRRRNLYIKRRCIKCIKWRQSFSRNN